MKSSIFSGSPAWLWASQRAGNGAQWGLMPPRVRVCPCKESALPLACPPESRECAQAGRGGGGLVLNGCDKTPRAGQGGWQPQEGTAGIEGSCSAMKRQRTISRILKDGLDGAQPVD